MESKAKSVFLKNLIKKIKPTNEETQNYVNDLLFIEHGILKKGALGWAGAVNYFYKKQEYSHEYNLMKLELLEKN